MTSRRRFGRNLLGLGSVWLVGCDAGRSKPVFKNADITGAEYARDFQLTGHDGKAYTLADFKGKVVVIFFGFAQCPDVCPTNLTELDAARKRLGAAGDRLQVLFITIDPERDTREVLAQYVPAFNTSFIGLYGDAAATAKTAKEFKVFYQKVPGKSPGSYTMEHSAGSYVFDANGKVRLFVRHGQGVDMLVSDLQQLLDPGQR